MKTNNKNKYITGSKTSPQMVILFVHSYDSGLGKSIYLFKSLIFIVGSHVDINYRVGEKSASLVKKCEPV